MGYDFFFLIIIILIFIYEGHNYIFALIYVIYLTENLIEVLI